MFFHFEEKPDSFPKQLHQSTFPSVMYKGPRSLTSLPALCIMCLFDCSHRDCVWSGISSCVCSCTCVCFPVTNAAEHLFINFMATCVSSLEKWLIKSFAHFYFFKDLFIYFRDRGREEERERNINMWLPFACPLLGTWPATQACALTGNGTSDLLGLHSIHWVTPARPLPIFNLVFILYYWNVEFCM